MKYTIFNDGDYGALFETATRKHLMSGEVSEIEYYLAKLEANYVDVPIYEDEPPTGFDQNLQRQLDGLG